MSNRYLAAKVLDHAHTGREAARAALLRGEYGPLYLMRGRQRGRMVALEEAVARHGEDAINRAIAAYVGKQRRRCAAVTELAADAIELVPA